MFVSEKCIFHIYDVFVNSLDFILSLYIINVEFKYEIKSILFTTIVFKERKTDEVVNK